MRRFFALPALKGLANAIALSTFFALAEQKIASKKIAH